MKHSSPHDDDLNSDKSNEPSLYLKHDVDMNRESCSLAVAAERIDRCYRPVMASHGVLVQYCTC